MNYSHKLIIALAILLGIVIMLIPARTFAETMSTEAKITIIYDTFGQDNSLQKD